MNVLFERHCIRGLLNGHRDVEFPTVNVIIVDLKLSEHCETVAVGKLVVSPAIEEFA